MNFKPLFLFFLVFVFLIALTNPCNALVFESVGAKGINNGNGYGSYDSGYNNFIYHTTSSVYLLDYSGSTTILLMNVTSGWTVKDAIVASDGYLYISTNYGIVKRISTSTNPQYFDTTIGTGTCILITSDSPERLREESGNIYYMIGQNVYRFSLNNYLVSLYDTLSISISNFGDFDIYNGDIYGLYKVTYWRVYKNNDLLYSTTNTYSNYIDSYLQVVNEEKIYFAIHTYGTTSFQTQKAILNIDGSVFSDFAYTTYNNYAPETGFGHIGNIESVGAVTNGDDLTVFSTDFSGRITTSSSTIISEYLQKNIDSLYDTYYNNSILQITYNVKTGALNISDAYNFKQDVYYRIDLIDNNGINIDSKFFYGSDFEEEFITMAGIIIISDDSYYKKSGIIEFKNNVNWEYGNYSVKLYELDLSNNNFALLDSDTFLILNETFNGSITTNTNVDTSESVDTYVLINKMLSSKIFIALLIIMAIAITGATVAGGVGFAIGSVLGTLVSVALELINTWVILLVFVVCLVAILILPKNNGG